MASGLPERIGRYRVIARLGKGAMGIVYAARDEEAGREVAVKIMMADLADEPETRTRFLREAQATSGLFHPNVIKLYDMGEEEGRVYLVMERLYGRTLGDHLARPDGVTLEQKLDLMLQVCDGLAAAHARGVFHRDIKPGNLFVTDDGTLKILDFGVARLASSTLTASGYIIGTPDYMSPEQARGREIDQRSDLFSAGGVFYYLLTGRKPFAAKDLPSVLRKVQSEDPPAISDREAPPALARIVFRALAKSPADRYQQAREMVDDLAGFQRDYEGETRRQLEVVAGRAAEVKARSRERAELGHWFGLGEDRAPDAWGRLEAAFPALADPGPMALTRLQLSRQEVVAVASAVDAEWPSLGDEVVRLRSARTAIESAERALSAGRPDQALPFLEQAGRSLPGLARIGEAIAHCRAAVDGRLQQGHPLRPTVAAPGPTVEAPAVAETPEAGRGQAGGPAPEAETVPQPAPDEDEDTVSVKVEAREDDTVSMPSPSPAGLVGTVASRLFALMNRLGSHGQPGRGRR